MKKIIFVILFVGFLFFFFQGKEEVFIPEEAIRFRVIANSDSEEDQAVKELVSRTLQKQVTTTLNDTTTIDEARKVLRENVPTFQETVAKTLLANQTPTPFRIHYGMNYFPEKVYHGVSYKAGEYESLVVTLGDGLGKNWWCVLFPPICLFEAEESKDSDQVEYKFFFQEIFDKYF